MIYTAGMNVAADAVIVYENGDTFEHEMVATIDTDKAQIQKYVKDESGKLKQLDEELVLETVSFSKIVPDRQEFPTKFTVVK